MSRYTQFTKLKYLIFLNGRSTLTRILGEYNTLLSQLILIRIFMMHYDIFVNVAFVNVP
jgi:hypothetical protein